MMSWSSKESDQASTNRERVEESKEQLAGLIIELIRFEQVSVTTVLFWGERRDPQLDRLDCKIAIWERQGAVGSEALISAVSCDTVLPTPLMMPALLVCWRSIAFTWLEAEDALEKVCTITVPTPICF